MAYTNSALAKAFCPSPHYSERLGPITKITVHHAAAVASAKQIANHFQAKSTKASANYVIGKDGEIVLCVEEKNRAWASAAPANDNLAVNIEVANSTTDPTWEVSDKAWRSLVALCVDICKRNNIERLEYTGGPSGNLTLHKFFVPTICPGPYLSGRMGELEKTVNEQLAPGRIMALEDAPAWARPTLEKLVQAEALKGTDAGLDLSMDMVRVLVIVDRMMGGTEQ